MLGWYHIWWAFTKYIRLQNLFHDEEVAQGSVLAVSLFLIHINSVCSIDFICKFPAFADDVVLLRNFIIYCEDYRKICTGSLGGFLKISCFYIKRTKCILFNLRGLNL